MKTNRTSRRHLLRTGAAVTGVAAVTGLSGCSGLDSILGGSGKDIENVPADSDVVLHTDVDAVLSDPATRELTNASLSAQAESEFYSGPENYEELLSTFEDESGLDPKAVSSLTLFWEWGGLDVISGGGYLGFLFSAEWTESELLDALEESDSEYTEDEYGGKTVYEPESEFNSTWVGVLGEGEFALATEDALEDVIDVANGDGDQLSKNLRDAYGNTRSAPVRFVGTVPSDQIPETVGEGDGSFNTELFTKVEHVSGSVYAEGDRRGVEMTFTATDQETADDIASLIDGFAVFARDMVDQEVAESALDAIDASHEGKRAIVTYEQPVDELVTLIEKAEESTGTQPRSISPVASFSFDYDSSTSQGDRGTLQITHDGGDSIPQSELYLRGSGFAAVNGVDMTFPGQWQGTVSGDYQGRPSVVAGDSVAVGVRSDYDIRVIWEASDGSSSATLAEDTGPDAF